MELDGKQTSQVLAGLHLLENLLHGHHSEVSEDSIKAIASDEYKYDYPTPEELQDLRERINSATNVPRCHHCGEPMVHAGVNEKTDGRRITAWTCNNLACWAKQDIIDYPPSPYKFEPTAEVIISATKEQTRLSAFDGPDEAYMLVSHFVDGAETIKAVTFDDADDLWADFFKRIGMAQFDGLAVERMIDNR